MTYPWDEWMRSNWPAIFVGWVLVLTLFALLYGRFVEWICRRKDETKTKAPQAKR